MPKAKAKAAPTIDWFGRPLSVTWKFERYKPNGRALTPREVELLTILIEEAGEVITATTKLLRFGYGDWPRRLARSNAVHFSRELGDYQAVLQQVGRLGLIITAEMQDAASLKPYRLRQYLQSPPDRKSPPIVAS